MRGDMADYQKMYVILCAAASDAADELADIPLAMRCRDKLQKALLAAEDIYMETNVHQHKFRIPKCLERKNVSYKIFCKIQRSCSYKCKFFHVAPPFTKQSVFVYLDNNICFIYFQVILTNYFIFVWFL